MSYFLPALSSGDLLELAIVVFVGICVGLTWFGARYGPTLQSRFEATPLYRYYQARLRRHYLRRLDRQERYYQARLRRREDN
jgi:hypothetical protein